MSPIKMYASEREPSKSLKIRQTTHIFPEFGLGLVLPGVIRVHDDMLLAASEALAAQVTEYEYYEKGLIYPPFSNMPTISANMAAKVYELESCMYNMPVYREITVEESFTSVKYEILC